MSQYANPIVAAYAAGGPLLSAALVRLTPAECQAFPVPGTWSITQIVVHLMDADLVASDRMKRIVAEDAPLLMNYDESVYVEKFSYNEMDPAIAAELFAHNRRMTADMLDRLPPTAYTRLGRHSVRGLISLESLVHGYTDHLTHHLKFLLEKRRLLGKPII